MKHTQRLSGIIGIDTNFPFERCFFIFLMRLMLISIVENYFSLKMFHVKHLDNHFCHYRREQLMCRSGLTNVLVKI